MWKCSYCAKGVEPELDACWSCGYSKDGEPPSLELVALLTAAKRDQKAEREVEKSNRLKKTTSLSGILCLRHSMSKRSIYANESKDRCGGHSGIAAHFV